MNRLISAVGLFIVGLWVLWLAQMPILQWLGVAWNSQTMGAWGETFGAFNALFGALGFGAVLLTLRQQQQMSEARDREHREHFDSSFFELLRLFREARLEVTFRHTMEYSKSIKAAQKESRDRHTGLEAFQFAWYELRHWIADEETSAEDAALAYERIVHKRYESTLGPYFRLLYTMLQRIRDDTALAPLDKIRYANLLRSQLTSFELAVAGLNGLCITSHDFGTLVVEFRLLKYLPGDRRRILGRYYPNSAFQARTGMDPNLFFRPKRKGRAMRERRGANGALRPQMEARNPRPAGALDAPTPAPALSVEAGHEPLALPMPSDVEETSTPEPAEEPADQATSIASSRRRSSSGNASSQPDSSPGFGKR